IVLENCGHIDPTDIDQYIANGGYEAAAKALQTSPDEIVVEVKRSELRGRGGAGFPAGEKWQSCRQASGKPKYIICNADEGDPGAFMDRSVLEGDPHSVIEGMAIGVPVVASDIGGLREIIEDGVSGILVQSKNPEAIKEAVKKILSDADLRDSIISEGIKKVEQFYTVQRQLELITGLYIKILIRDSDYFSIDIMKKNSRCP
ncbi:MAG: glycosyltransferase, partial [Candidatus Omnitrophica bacterium]|nr:glycosyltransferase [Candidatus Omnitrophota bacterium]